MFPDTFRKSLGALRKRPNTGMDPTRSATPHRLALSSGAQPVSRKGNPSCCYAIHPQRTNP